MKPRAQQQVGLGLFTKALLIMLGCAACVRKCSTVHAVVTPSSSTTLRLGVAAHCRAALELATLAIVAPGTVSRNAYELKVGTIGKIILKFR